MDPLLIEQVLMNLMENAFVHSETNRPVELQISEESDTITFHVIDYGKGIDEQTIPLILKGEYHVPKNIGYTPWYGKSVSPSVIRSSRLMADRFPLITMHMVRNFYSHYRKGIFNYD